jgi:hypothetical protein
VLWLKKVTNKISKFSSLFSSPFFKFWLNKENLDSSCPYLVLVEVEVLVVEVDSVVVKIIWTTQFGGAGVVVVTGSRTQGAAAHMSACLKFRV